MGHLYHGYAQRPFLSLCCHVWPPISWTRAGWDQKPWDPRPVGRDAQAHGLPEIKKALEIIWRYKPLFFILSHNIYIYILMLYYWTFFLVLVYGIVVYYIWWLFFLNIGYWLCGYCWLSWVVLDAKYSGSLSYCWAYNFTDYRCTQTCYWNITMVWNYLTIGEIFGNTYIIWLYIHSIYW